MLGNIYALFNVVAAIAFGLDKYKAVKGAYRISEKTLLILGLLGPFGALSSMLMFRHKIRNRLFCTLIPIFFALNTMLILLLEARVNR